MSDDYTGVIITYLLTFGCRLSISDLEARSAGTGTAAAAVAEVDALIGGLDCIRGYHKRDGTYVQPHLAHDPGRKARAAKPTRNVRAKKRGRGIAVIITIAGIGTAAITINGGLSGGSKSLSDDSGARSVNTDTPTEIRLDLNRTEAVLLASGCRVDLNVRFDKNCAANSYGLVHNFFISDPCKWLARASLTLHGKLYNAILIAVSWVGMRNIASAEKYKHLVGAAGTGNVTELTRVSGPYRNIRFSGEITGTTVWNAQAPAVHGHSCPRG